MIKLIPAPQVCEIIKHKTFIVPYTIYYTNYSDINIDNAIANFAKYLERQAKIKLVEKEENAIITFRQNQDLNKDAYMLDINEKIDIQFADYGGAIYAIQTLQQLFFNYSGHIPALHIHDFPKTAYRGFMLDSGRYFQPVQEVCKFIDLLVVHKINYLHWHLTEDQGWRIEIDSYPLLHQKGSKRSHTNFNHKPHSGYYTKEQIRYIVQYCKDRNIQVIPEFDIPGHTRSAIACYPELSCFDRKLEVATHWGVKHDILCAGKDGTYTFVKAVLDEICELFPCEYIHIGGDEAVKTRWEICPHCQTKIKELGLKNTNQLQAYFINQIAAYLEGKGKKVIIWNEYDDSGICAPNIIWQMWNGEQELYDRLDRDQRQYINADSTAYYLDLPYYQSKTLENVYNYEPTSRVQNKSLYIGAEACLWTEMIPTFKKAMNMSIPRLTAFAERNWTNVKDYKAFQNNLEIFYKYLYSLGYKDFKKIKTSNSNFTGFFEKLWFERRQLYWEGLHNIIDNKKVYKIAKKRNK